VAHADATVALVKALRTIFDETCLAAATLGYCTDYRPVWPTKPASLAVPA